MSLDDRKSEIYDEWRDVLNFWFEHPSMTFIQMINAYIKFKGIR
jgi:hypothetical protein